MSNISEILDFLVTLILVLLLLTNVLIRLWKKGHASSEQTKLMASKLRWVNMGCLMSLGIFLTYLFFSPPRIVDTFPDDGSVVCAGQVPIELTFDRWVRVESVRVTITPSVSGEWRRKRGFLGTGFSKKMVFVPQETLAVGSSYQLEISDFQGLWGPPGGAYFFSFQTLVAPVIVGVTPNNNQENVVLDAPIEVLLDHEDDLSVEWEFVLKPEVDFVVSTMDNKPGFQLRPVGKLTQETRYTLTVYQIPVVYGLREKKVIHRGDKNKVYEGAFTTILAPKVLTTSPKGSKVLPNEPMKIRFTKEMDAASLESLLRVSPETAGSFSWPDGKTVVFTPDVWGKGAKYLVTIPEGVKDAEGGFLMETESFEFSTVGVVKVEEFFPVSQAVGVDIDTYISVKFDQVVDHKSAEDRFLVTPNVGGTFLWKGSVMTFVPEEKLAYNRVYQVRVKSGVKSVYGLDSVQEYTSSFTTRKYQVKLNVPLIHQEHSHTCNIAAARMLLAFRGVYLTEQQILEKIGVDSTPYDKDQGIWGDPNSRYVGNIDGKPKGYGVHWDPIARVVREYREATVYRNWSLPSLLGEVEKGNPVMLWWQNGWNDPDPISWYTPEGEFVQGVEGMHSEVVIGFVGDKDDPDEIIMNDPWRGVRHYTKEYFFRQWKFYNNTGLVVY